MRISDFDETESSAKADKPQCSPNKSIRCGLKQLAILNNILISFRETTCDAFPLTLFGTANTSPRLASSEA